MVFKSAVLEKLFLSLLLLDNSALTGVSFCFKPDYFYYSVNALIYSAVCKLVASGVSVSLSNVDELMSLSGSKLFPSGFSVRSHLVSVFKIKCKLNLFGLGQHLYHVYRKRTLYNMGRTLAAAACTSSYNAFCSRIRAVEKSFLLLSCKGLQRALPSFGSCLDLTLERVASAYKGEESVLGLSTGIASVDEFIGGLRGSELIVVAGRPGVGKTSLAINIAYNVSSAYGKRAANSKYKTGGVVLFFSLEMSLDQLVFRVLSDEVGVASNKIKAGELTELEYSRVMGCRARIGDIPFYIDDRGDLSVSALIEQASRLKLEVGLDLIVVDYLQLVGAADATKAFGNRVVEMAEVSGRLKTLSKTLNLPVLVLSQMSRQVELRESKQPKLCDLRESGAIEQNADIVLFICRTEDASAMANVVVAKHRNGPIGSFKLKFVSELTKFESAGC
ncbi:MAG: DnaB-like helicase C-terminal domain-containing protein [Candidatus Hodgkinia cicadicola]|nr:MAG: DnaB-like helicase C-terminal domain-containing protein [Candidatus Hodgkinia cicadicola]